MNVRFRTNLDLYRAVSWPVISYKPSKGERVRVIPACEEYCRVNNLPYELEIVQITHKYDHVECELWYSKIDQQLYKREHLFGQ
jgi:hypothetical protein